MDHKPVITSNLLPGSVEIIVTILLFIIGFYDFIMMFIFYIFIEVTDGSDKCNYVNK